MQSSVQQSLWKPFTTFSKTVPALESLSTVMEIDILWPTCFRPISHGFFDPLLLYAFCKSNGYLNRNTEKKGDETFTLEHATGPQIQFPVQLCSWKEKKKTK